MAQSGWTDVRPRARTIAVVAVACAAGLVVDLAGSLKAQSGQTVTTVAAVPAAPQTQGGQRGGPSPGSLLWAEHCAGCHGTGASAGRAPMLFDEAWLNRVGDADIIRTIENGVPNTEMPAFSSAFTDQQIFQLVQHIHTETAAVHRQLTNSPTHQLTNSPNDWPDGRVVDRRGGRLRRDSAQPGRSVPTTSRGRVTA